MSGAAPRDPRFIKGTAFISKQRYVERQFGREAWDHLLARMAAKEVFFTRPVLASTMIPWRAFLAFQDELIAQLHGGDVSAYWTIGARSADWALVEGPYKHYHAGRDIAGYVDAIPRMSRAYFTFGEYAAQLDGASVRLSAKGLPIWHAYFEYMVVGFHKRAFELLGAQVVARCTTPAQCKDFRYELTLSQ